ncbi:unnamed protein product [Arctogadus glacialis]
MPEVNLLSAAAVLFRGGTYTELSDWCQTMGLQMIGTTTFYNIQKAYLHLAIENVYREKRTELLARVYLEQEDGKRPHLAVYRGHQLRSHGATGFYEMPTTVTGEPRFKQVYCKKSKQWILKTIFTPHTTEFIRHLINRVMDRRHDPNITLNVPTSSLTLAQPALPANIAPVPKPPKEAATTLFKSRF